MLYLPIFYDQNEKGELLIHNVYVTDCPFQGRIIFEASCDTV
jgi:hypothetical protein